MKYNIKEMVKDKTVFFVEYRKGELIYSTEDGFEFPVPIDEAGDGVFLLKDKAITFMRYIRMQIARIEKERNVFFVKYRKGELIYCTEDGFEFPVPIDVASDGVFVATDKEITFMPYIKMHMANIEKEKELISSTN